MIDTIRFSVGPIEVFSWGRFVIRGEEHTKQPDGSLKGAGKDICLSGETVLPWKERKGHLLTPEMVHCALRFAPDTMIIGNGVYGAVEVPPAVRETLLEHGIKEVIVRKTPEACELYNQLFLKGEKVLLLAHGTC